MRPGFPRKREGSVPTVRLAASVSRRLPHKDVARRCSWLQNGIAYASAHPDSGKR